VRLTVLSISSTAVLHAAVLAHPGGGHAHGSVWRMWSWEPSIVIPLLLVAMLYAVGVHRLWRASATGRGIYRWEVISCAGGWLTLVLALLSPVHPIGEELFWVHMVQHELLMAIAAPLLVLGRPLMVFVWALPARWRRGATQWTTARPLRASWRVLTAPAVAWALQAVVLLAWHVPALFDAALESEALHALQHICFLGSALLFWWSLARGNRARASDGAAIIYLFTTGVSTSVLGVLLTFAPRPWYTAYGTSALAWGLTPLEDQQLAGLVMWVPAGVVYVVAALMFFTRWLRESEWQTRRIEQHAAGERLIVPGGRRG
jgi:cytochrome c oxidase assembly factor CtaG